MRQPSLPNGTDRLWTKNAVPVLSVSVLFALVYGHTVQGLFMDWWRYSTFRHGFAIPLFAAYLFWSRRDRFRACSKEISLPGMGIFLLGLALFYVGRVGEEEFVERLSLLVSLIGLIYFLGGSSVARLSAFPVAYLALMIPFPYPVYKSFALELRLLDSKLTAYFGRFLGVPIHRDGFLLYLPEVTLEVADACSGVFSILATVSVGILYIHQVRFRWKWLLWILLIPISILSNVIRITLTAVLTYYSGEWILRSVFHQAAGVFNFLVGLALLVAVSTISIRLQVGRELKA